MARFVDYRLKNEFTDLELFDNWSFKEILNNDTKFYKVFEFRVHVLKGIFINRKFAFHINIFEDYPFRSPKVVCIDKIFHPNIDVNGNVCLSILRENWSCASGLMTVLLGIYCILSDFDGIDALNTDAGDLMTNDLNAYIRKATEYDK